MGDKFWMVIRNIGGSAPSKRHDTKEDAIAEASRLVRQTNEKYYVLEAIGSVATVQSPVVYSEFDQVIEQARAEIGKWIDNRLKI